MKTLHWLVQWQSRTLFGSQVLSSREPSMQQVTRVPDGFAVFPRTSPFLESVGEFYVHGAGAQMRLGVFVEPRACNRRGKAHGGFLTGLADVALGYALANSQAPAGPLITTSLSIDFAGGADCGDWIETSVEIQRLGSQLAFANAYLHVAGKRIVRASGVFARTRPGVNRGASISDGGRP
jgi:acyl-coenzyme A thioesterase 13